MFGRKNQDLNSVSFEPGTTPYHLLGVSCSEASTES